MTIFIYSCVQSSLVESSRPTTANERSQLVQTHHVRLIQTTRIRNVFMIIKFFMYWRLTNVLKARSVCCTSEDRLNVQGKWAS